MFAWLSEDNENFNYMFPGQKKLLRIEKTRFLFFRLSATRKVGGVNNRSTRMLRPLY